MEVIIMFGRKIRFLILIMLMSLFSFPLASRATEQNSLTFVNKSGEDALVKIVGPSKRGVEVPNKKSRTVNIAGGTYVVYVRYGKNPDYRYAKGESFEIEDSTSTYTQASLTLHGVVNGNYHIGASSESEFNSY